MVLAQQFFIMIGLSLTGFFIFNTFKIMSPAIMGPMVGVGAYQAFFGGLPELPGILISVFQMIIGLSVGSKINHNTLGEIKKTLAPSLIISGFTLVLTVIMTLFVCNFTDPLTALFSASPGGVAEMSVIAFSYDTDIAIITTYQFVRLVVIYLTVPAIASLLIRKKPPLKEELREVDLVSAQPFSAKRLFLYAVGIGGGLIGIFLGFPGGGVIGSVLFLGIANVLFKDCYVFPGKLMKIALFGMGVTIGLEFSVEMLNDIRQMFLPIIFFSVFIVMSNILISLLIKRVTHWDIATCILAAAPGGLSQMIAVGEELKANTIVISVLQFVRLITIILTVPIAAAVWFS